MAATGRAKTALYTFMDIPPEEEAGFKDWYNREHMRDRILVLPGFLRGRRFLNVSGGPKYLAMYEAEDANLLKSPEYLKLISTPDPASRHFILKFQNAIRTVARISGSFGEAEGGALAVLPFSPAPEQENDLRRHLLEQVAPFLMAQPGVVACQLMERDESVAASSRNQHVRQGDRKLDWALMVEGNETEDLQAAVAVAGALLDGITISPLPGATYLRTLYRVSPN